MANEDGNVGQELAELMKTIKSKEDMDNKIRIYMSKYINQNPRFRYIPKTEVELQVPVELKKEYKKVEGSELLLEQDSTETKLEKTNEEQEDPQKIRKTLFFMKYQGEDLLIAIIDQNGKPQYIPENLQKVDPENKMQLQDEKFLSKQKEQKQNQGNQTTESSEVKKDEDSKDEKTQENNNKNPKEKWLADIALNREITKGKFFQQLVPNTDQYTKISIYERSYI